MGSDGIAYTPLSFVRAVLTRFVPVFRAVIVTPGITAPDLSRATPVMPAPLKLCASSSNTDKNTDITHPLEDNTFQWTCPSRQQNCCPLELNFRPHPKK